MVKKAHSLNKVRQTWILTPAPPLACPVTDLRELYCPVRLALAIGGCLYLN